mmetsp:Transcript_5989/g.14513  ORF Transcript_5989/g.14513 Transcript_5989/m.14513 type:complete len:454 (-) Transcript_5989:426-1787(-)
MPPQRDEMETAEERAITSKPNGDDNTSSTAEGSYWEAPDVEESLKGKTLSTLDMTALESNHPEEQKKKKDDYWAATPDKSLEGKTLSTPDMKPASSPSSSPKSITAEEPNEVPSYWDDAPIDKSLEGKRLSSLDVSALATNHPDQEQEKQIDYWGDTPKEDETLKGKTLSTLDISALESNHPDEHQQKRDDYWGATPKEEETLKGKTLSTLEMSALEANHPDEKKDKGDSYWEAPEEDKLKGKRLSNLDLNTLEAVESPDNAPITATEESGPASYWDEAPIEEALRGKRLSAVDLAVMNSQRADDNKKKESSTPYWEWQGVKAIKKTLSKISLSNLRRGSAHDVVLDDDDCVHGATNSKQPASISATDSSHSINSSNSDPVKPITNKKHKLRDSWRRSFQRLSTNTLDQLDESSGSGPRLLGKRIFKTSKNPLDWSTGSRGSQASIGEDAIMF